MLRRTLLLTVILLCPVFADESAAVEAAERNFGKGVTTNDFALLDKVLANDLMYSHSNGLVDTKASYIDALKSGKAKYITVDYTMLKVVPIDKDTAYVTCQANVTTMQNGKPNPMDLKMLHIFRKNKGQWQLMAHQSARMPPKP
jgi:ketosteroid isomerase-like protein